MAREVIEKLICDIHANAETPERHEGNNHVDFVHDEKIYAMDLCDSEKKQYDELMAPYVAVAVGVLPKPVVPAPAPRGSRGSSRNQGSGTDTEHVRAHARKMGWPVSDKGRVSGDYVKAWEAAGSPRIIN